MVLAESWFRMKIVKRLEIIIITRKITKCNHSEGGVFKIPVSLAV